MATRETQSPHELTPRGKGLDLSFLGRPHEMAFYSGEAQAELQRRAGQEVVRAPRGEPPDRQVNPEVLPGAAR